MAEKSKGPQKQSFLHGAAILAGATILIKVIGALFKIPLVNILGAEGFGSFSVAYNIYSLLLTISTAGLPVALSKMIAEANALNRQNQIRRIYTVALGTFIAVGACGSLIMGIFAKPLANSMGDSKSWYSILTLAPALLFVCVMSSLRGYFQGHSDMRPTAISQIIEALCKLCFGLALAYFVVKAGKGEEVGAAASIIGVVIGTVLGALYLVLTKLKRGKPEKTDDTPDGNNTIFKRLMSLAIPITIGASALSLIGVIDNAIVLNRLQSALGLTEDAARGLYGSYSSAQTVFNFPPALIVPLTISVIPSVSEALTGGNRLGAVRTTKSAMKVMALIAIPASIGLSVLAKPIMQLLYIAKPDIISVGTPLLRILGPVVFFDCLVLLSNSVLQANGYVYIPVISMIAGGLAKILVNWILVGIPSINITGAPIGSLVCFMVIAAMDVFAIKRLMPRQMSFVKIIVKPLAAAVVMGGAAWAVYGLISKVITGYNRISLGICVLFSMAVAVAIYVILVLVFRYITREDMRLLPKGDKLADILKIK